MERQKLFYLKQNQKALRAENYNVIQDHMSSGDVTIERQQIGRVMILPATYVGSLCYMNARYQDAMAIVRTHGKPDLFITMTMNPNHPDVIAALLPAQVSSNRPDIIARVFKRLLDMLLEDIKKGIFGEMVGLVYSVEYQARGLPHAHILVFLHVRHRFNMSEDIDRVICAEIPEDNVLRDLVLTFMRHAPCGILYPNASCMIEDKCCSMDHPIYQRRPVDQFHPWFESQIR